MKLKKKINKGLYKFKRVYKGKITLTDLLLIAILITLIIKL